MSPGTEFARDFCAGIGPLQLGVVLVYYLFNTLEKMLKLRKSHKIALKTYRLLVAFLSPGMDDMVQSDNVH